MNDQIEKENKHLRDCIKDLAMTLQFYANALMFKNKPIPKEQRTLSEPNPNENLRERPLGTLAQEKLDFYAKFLKSQGCCPNTPSPFCTPLPIDQSEE